MNKNMFLHQPALLRNFIELKSYCAVFSEYLSREKVCIFPYMTIFNVSEPLNKLMQLTL